MKRSNYPLDLQLYQHLFKLYYSVVSEIQQRTGLELTELEQELKLFRPKRNGNLPEKYCRYFDQAGIANDKVTISVAGFSCSFPLAEIITYKRIVERKLITPKHHRYYVDVAGSKKELQAA